MPSAKELAKALARQDSVTQQPRNRFLGAIADAAGYVSDQADRYVVPERDPLFGGMRGGDLLPFRNVNRLLDDLSYGGRITTGRGQTTALRPEVVDTVALGGAMMPAAKSLSKAALREGARQIETGTGIGRAALNPKMSVLPDAQAMNVPRSQAKVGGEDAISNGYFYKGGQFLPSTQAEPGKWKVDKKWISSGKALIAPGEFANQPTPFSRSLFEMIQGHSIKDDAGKLAVNPNLTDINGETLFRPGVKGVLGKQELKLQEMMDAYNSGQRWFDVKPNAATITTGERNGVGGAMIPRPKTEFEILHDTAQRNAALPVEQGGLGLPAGNTYIDRANAPGMWPDDGYHGSNVDIKEFNPSLAGTSSATKTGKSKFIWATSSPKNANNYVDSAPEIIKQDKAHVFSEYGDAGRLEGKALQDLQDNLRVQSGGVIYPLRIRTEGALIKDGKGRVTTNKDFARQLAKNPDYESGIVNNTRDVSPDSESFSHYLTSNPANIRSRFAAFDPFRRHEADILAGVGVGGMLDPQAIAEALRQQDRK